MARAKGRCEVTGIWFSEEKVEGPRRRPWAPAWTEPIRHSITA